MGKECTKKWKLDHRESVLSYAKKYNKDYFKNRRENPTKFCIDCGKGIDIRSIARCHLCNNKYYSGDKSVCRLITGERTNNWRGGVSNKNRLIRKKIEYRLWREAVFARDNWTCQECGKRGYVIHPHHIKEFAKYPELRFSIDNGKTLCVECHKKIHRKVK